MLKPQSLVDIFTSAVVAVGLFLGGLGLYSANTVDGALIDKCLPNNTALAQTADGGIHQGRARAADHSRQQNTQQAAQYVAEQVQGHGIHEQAITFTYLASSQTAISTPTKNLHSTNDNELFLIASSDDRAYTQIAVDQPCSAAQMGEASAARDQSERGRKMALAGLFVIFAGGMIGGTAGYARVHQNRMNNYTSK